MALITALPELSVMRVIPEVAVHTTLSHIGNRSARRSRSGVTGFTSGTGVRARQRVFGLSIVIELPRSPVPGVVAAFTTGAKFALVLVRLEMT